MKIQSTTADPLELELRGPIAILRLNRPRVHNVVDSATIDWFEKHLTEIDQHSEVIVIVLTGTGNKTFCAGSDLDEISQIQKSDQAIVQMRRMQEILDRLESGPQVTLGAINGSAYGGGCELLTACHLRLAASTAQFSFRQASMGLSTGWGGGGRLFRQLGRAGALRLLLTADTIEADAAHDLGLVDQVLPQGQVLPVTLELAERIAVNNPDSLRGFLRIAKAVETQPNRSTLELETQLFSELLEGEHYKRRAAAWRARRRKSN